MKNLYPIDKKVTVLNEVTDKEIGIVILFSVLTKKQHDNFCSKLTLYNSHKKGSLKRNELDHELNTLYNFTFADIRAIGDTKIDGRTANGYIDNNTININGIAKRNYKCFVNEWEDGCHAMNQPYHEDGGSSWNCLMQLLRNPEYGVIFTIPITKLTKFNING